MHKRILWMLLAVLMLSVFVSAGRADFVETFTTDPVNTRAWVQGTNQSKDTAGNPVAPFMHAGPGVLTHNLHTNWDYLNYGFGPRGQGDGSRLSWSLGRTYTESDRFSFGATLTIHSSGLAPEPENLMAVAFGLTNSTTTGFDRSGAWTGDRDAFDSLEWNFFPNESQFGWPTLQQTAIGAQLGDPDSMFFHFAANFNLDDSVDGGVDTLLAQEKADPTHPLYGNTYGLPLDMPMEVTMSYDGPSRTLSMRIVDATTGTVLIDDATLPDLDLSAPVGGFGSVNSFQVDQLSIMNYQDGWAFGNPTLVARVDYSEVWFSGGQPIPEPRGAVLLVGGLGLLLCRRRRRA
jgi:hypothetical protein